MSNRLLLNRKGVLRSLAVMFSVLVLYMCFVNYFEVYGTFLRQRSGDIRDPRLPERTLDIPLPRLELESLVDGENVFFLETTNKTAWTGRQLCAFESAARHNPQKRIRVLMTSPVLLPSRAVESLLAARTRESLGIDFFHFDPEEVFNQTLMHSWFSSGVWRDADPFVLSRHIADALRLALLFKFGGTYLDTDVISLRSISDLPKNTVGEEYGVPLLNNGVLINFEAHNIFLEQCMYRGSKQYSSSDWMAIGPGLLTAIYQENAESLRSTQELHVEPYTSFHPIRGTTSFLETINPWNFFIKGLSSSATYFNPSKKDVFDEATRESYTIHLFSSGSDHFAVDPQSVQQPLAAVAQTHCPIAFRESVHF